LNMSGGKKSNLIKKKRWNILLMVCHILEWEKSSKFIVLRH
jgi:hypothetical protein